MVLPVTVMLVDISVAIMQVTVSLAIVQLEDMQGTIMQVVFSAVQYAHNCFYCNYAGDCFCYSYAGDSFK